MADLNDACRRTRECVSDAARQRNLLERRELIAQAALTHPAVLVCFDVLAGAGQDFRSQPLGARRNWLHQNVSSVARLQIIGSVESTKEKRPPEGDRRSCQWWRWRES